MLKKLFSILLSVMLIVNACAVCGVFAAENEPQTPSNLLANGDFEGTIANYWIGSTVTADKSNPHGGTQAAKSTGRTAAGTILKQQGVTFKVGRTYDCKAWIRGAASSNTFNAMIASASVRLDTDNDGWAYIFTAKSPEGVDTWTQLTGTFKMLADNENSTNTENSYTVTFEEIDGATDTVYIDDFSIVPKYYVNSISITGDDTVSFPGTTYTAQVLNQTGNTDEVPQNVTWSITSAPNGVSIVEDTGELIIENSNTEGTVVIKATAEEYGCIAFNEKTVTLEKAELPPKSEADRKELVEEKLTSSVILDTNTSLNAVTGDLKLTQSTGYDDIKWYSDKTYVVNPYTGEVTRTAYDELVRLIAEYTIGETTYTETVDLCVLATDGTENPKVVGNNVFPAGDFARGTEYMNSWYNIHPTETCNGSNIMIPSDLNNGDGTPSYIGYYDTAKTISIEKGIPHRYTVWLRFDNNSTTKTGYMYIKDDAGTKYIPLQSSKNNFSQSDSKWHKWEGVYTYSGTGTADVTLHVDTASGSETWGMAGLSISPITDTTPARIYEDNGTKLLSNSELTGAMAINKLIRPTAADGADVTMLAASYDADKQLLDCSLISDTLTTGTAKNLCTKLSAKADTKYVKVFLWNKASVMNPLRALETFEVPTVE